MRATALTCQNDTLVQLDTFHDKRTSSSSIHAESRLFDAATSDERSTTRMEHRLAGEAADSRRRTAEIAIPFKRSLCPGRDRSVHQPPPTIRAKNGTRTSRHEAVRGESSRVSHLRRRDVVDLEVRRRR